MKTIDAKCPGVITLVTEGHNDNYLARRDFVDTFNSIRINLLNESMKEKEQSWNPVLHAGLLFFKELGIKGYKLEVDINRSLKTGLNLLEDEVLEATSLKAMNMLLDTRLSLDELKAMGSKVSKKIPSILENDTVIVNQDEEVIGKEANSRDCFYNLLLLNDNYKDVDLFNFFLNGEVDLDKGDIRYQELLRLRDLMQSNNARHISMNGKSNVIISSYQNLQDRFNVYRELKEKKYSISQLNRGTGMTMIKMYR